MATMRVLFTGATGVLGREAIPRLIEDGHEVTAVVRSDTARSRLEQMGVRPVVVDLFDREASVAATRDQDAIVHFATAIPSAGEMTKQTAWHMNDRLRAETTRYLVDGALHHDVELFIQQSVTLMYADGGDQWLDEGSAIAPVWQVLESAREAERQVDRFTAAGGRGVALRLGRVYGPGRASAEYLDGVRRGKIPVIGRGDNFVSHLHAADAGRAVSRAFAAPSGAYNVVDGVPIGAADELDLLADLLGASQARRVPYPVARVVAGRAARLLAVSHRVSADRFRAVTGWEPHYPSAKEGWPEVVAESRRAA